MTSDNYYFAYLDPQRLQNSQLIVSLWIRQSLCHTNVLLLCCVDQEQDSCVAFRDLGRVWMVASHSCVAQATLTVSKIVCPADRCLGGYHPKHAPYRCLTKYPSYTSPTRYPSLIPCQNEANQIYMQRASPSRGKSNIHEKDNQIYNQIYIFLEFKDIFPNLSINIKRPKVRYIVVFKPPKFVHWTLQSI